MMKLNRGLLVAGMVIGSCLANQAHAAYSHVVNIRNYTDQDVTLFYATPTGDPDVGANVDWIGNGVIEPNYQIIRDFSDGCYYDFKAILADGRVAAKNGVDVCQITFFDVTSN